MSDEVGLEKELKFPCDDLSSLREKLQESEAERIAASALEDNLIFDRDGELRTSGRLLRLRQDANGAHLTFKGPARYEDNVKIRVEEESRVDDAAVLHRILENLGYTVIQRYQKHREQWRLGGVIICLDHTPIGDYVEFEGENAGTLARRFGLSPETAEPRSYLKIYADYRKEDPSAPEDMVFP